jgi:hypothetical protein
MIGLMTIFNTLNRSGDQARIVVNNTSNGCASTALALMAILVIFVIAVIS